jgi:hypothetical protein
METGPHMDRKSATMCCKADLQRNGAHCKIGPHKDCKTGELALMVPPLVYRYCPPNQKGIPLYTALFSQYILYSPVYCTAIENKRKNTQHSRTFTFIFYLLAGTF